MSKQLTAYMYILGLGLYDCIHVYFLCVISRQDTPSRIPSAGRPGQLSHGDSEGRPVGRPVIRPPVDPGDVFTDTDTGLDDLGDI